MDSKKLKVSEEQCNDRLSRLPDCLLLYILSYLTTVNVVRTSALSKRWENMYTSVANIDLAYEVPNHIVDEEKRRDLRQSFLVFVGKVLSLHNDSIIRSMRLVFPIEVDDSSLNKWIRDAIKHKVEYLHLDLEVNGDSGLPRCLFSCKSLVVLKLSLDCTLKAPVDTHLPNLETLRLSEVEFRNDQTVECLFNNCPVLDKLGLVECNWDNIDNVTIFLPMLRTLIIKGDPSSDISDTRIKVIATGLVCLKFCCHLDVEFELTDLYSLETASIDLPYDQEDEEEVATRAARLFFAIENVKSLDISAETLKYLKDVEAFLHLPMFCKMTSLTVNSIFNASCCVFLLGFLGKMPKLEYLDLSKGSCEDGYTSLGDDLTEERVPLCFKSSLKTFAFGNFYARQHEIVLLEYVLRYATSLKSLSISCSILLQEERLAEAKDRLLNVPKGSQSCNVEFIF